MTKRNTLQGFGKWNRKLHIYLGLYFLLFLWLFSISGLVMNHPKWFGYKVERTPREQQVSIPEGLSDGDAAKHLREHLGLKGEILLRQQRREGHLMFMVLRPNKRVSVNLNRASGLAKITEVTPKANVMLGDIHTFTGVRAMWNEPAQERDWIITRLWSLSMDAVCIGLLYMVISSIYMGFQLREKRKPVIASLTAGCALCAWFVWGLTMTA